MFWDCIKVKVWSGRLLCPKSTIDCVIVFFIRLVLCPYFPREESEKSKKVFKRKFFYVDEGLLFLRCNF